MGSRLHIHPVTKEMQYLMIETARYRIERFEDHGWHITALSEPTTWPVVYVSTEPDPRALNFSHLEPLPWKDHGVLTIRLSQSMRHYVHLHHGDHIETFSDRIVPLEGGINFRDLGGYRNPQGQMVRWGTLYRSGKLSGLTSRDQAYIRQLGIQVVCDLRSAHELQTDPTPPDLAPSLAHLPLKLRETSSVPGHLDQETAQALLRESYEAFPTSLESYTAFFRTLLNNESGAVLFHCTAGKDRTGVTAALLLWALDIPWDIIVEDFLISNQFSAQLATLVATQDKTVGPTHPLWPMARAYPENLRAAIHVILNEYGNLDRFFTYGLGLDNDWKDALQHKYLVS